MENIETYMTINLPEAFHFVADIAETLLNKNQDLFSGIAENETGVRGCLAVYPADERAGLVANEEGLYEVIMITETGDKVPAKLLMGTVSGLIMILETANTITKSLHKLVVTSVPFGTENLTVDSATKMIYIHDEAAAEALKKSGMFYVEDQG